MKSSVVHAARRQSPSLRLTAVSSALLALAAQAVAAPRDGVVVSGSATIASRGPATVVTQTSQRASLQWSGFNIAAGESVQFVQPSASAVAVNRITDTLGTRIFGSLQANGQVWLINPNGVLFGPGAQVNVAGLLASTLEPGDAVGGRHSLAGASRAAVVNQGSIVATGASGTGGYVALLGATVRNEGSIQAPGGVVALGAGSAVTLDFDSDRLVRMQIDRSVVDTLVDNGGLVRADGGKVWMTAGARDSVLAAVVNNTGIVQARTVAEVNGEIVLMGAMGSGQVNVGGTLDASAPSGGKGGFIETSAGQVRVAPDAVVTTAAPLGESGRWLIDPVDFSIVSGTAAQGTSGIGATTLANSLAAGNVSIATDASTSGTGDITIEAPVSWSANRLSLSAHGSIHVNANLNLSATAGLDLLYGQGAVASGNTAQVMVTGARVNMPAGTTNFTSKLGSDGTTINYRVITLLGAAGSTTGNDLQGMNGFTAGSSFALGADIDASATASWNAGAGFAPVAGFSGHFDGLGHVITGLTINRPTTDNVGLFGQTTVINPASAVIRNVGLSGGSITGQDRVGALVGYSTRGTVFNTYSTASVSGRKNVGGLVGVNDGSNVRASLISDSYSTGNVTGSGDWVGGLVGYAASHGVTRRSFATGTVTGSRYVGGLVGLLATADIEQSYATGNVTGLNDVGGLLGGNDEFSRVSNSYARGNVHATGTGDTLWFIRPGAEPRDPSPPGLAGGLIGYSVGSVINSYSTGAVTSDANRVGGLVQLAVRTGNSVGSLSGNFWDTVTSAVATSSTGVGLTTAQLKDQANLTSATAANGNLNPDWDFASVWQYKAGVNDGYPVLATIKVKPAAVVVDNPVSVVSYRLSTPASVTYNATDQLLASLLPATFTGATGLVAGVDYAYRIGGQTVSAVRNAGSYGSVSITLLNKAYQLSESGNVDGSLEISPAELLYVASPKSIAIGDAVPALDGQLQGLRGTDALGQAVTGSLAWSSSYQLGAAPGSYAVNGTGLSAGNYVIRQASGNATALQVRSELTPRAGSALTQTVRPQDGTRGQDSGPSSTVSERRDDGQGERRDPSTGEGPGMTGRGPLLQVVNGGVNLPAHLR